MANLRIVEAEKAMLVKVNALLHRSSAVSAETINAGKIRLQPNPHKVYLDDREITLIRSGYKFEATI